MNLRFDELWQQSQHCPKILAKLVVQECIHTVEHCTSTKDMVYTTFDQMLVEGTRQKLVKEMEKLL